MRPPGKPFRTTALCSARKVDREGTPSPLISGGRRGCQNCLTSSSTGVKCKQKRGPRLAERRGLTADYLPISINSNVLGTGRGRGFGFFAVGDTGMFFDVPMVKT